MRNFTIEEINLLSIYDEDGKQGFAENINAALPYIWLLYAAICV